MYWSLRPASNTETVGKVISRIEFREMKNLHLDDNKLDVSRELSKADVYINYLH